MRWQRAARCGAVWMGLALVYYVQFDEFALKPVRGSLHACMEERVRTAGSPKSVEPDD